MCRLSVCCRADVADQQYGWQDDLFGDAQWRPAEVSADGKVGPCMHRYRFYYAPPLCGECDSD